MLYKGREIHPYESFYWNESPAFVRGELGGGISRTVKCDDSLATMVIDEDRQDNLLEQQGGGGYNRASKIESTTLEDVAQQ